MKKLSMISMAGVILLGVGCAPEAPTAPKADEKKPAQEASATETVGVWVHPKFGFKFQIPLGVLAKIHANGNDVVFVDAGNAAIEYARMAVQPGIPGIPLPDSKVEKLKIDGVAGHLYHDTDQADGGNVDKLIVDFPDGKNTVYLSSAELPGVEMWDLKAVAKSWKWKK